MISWLTPFSSIATGFIAAICIDKSLPTSLALSKFSEKPTIDAILFPAWMYDPTKLADICSKEPISIFSPIIPVCSNSFSETFIPSKSESKKDSLSVKPRA